MVQQSLEERSLSDQRSLVTFRLDRQSYALPIEPLVQITPMVTISPVPQTGDSVRGIINVRGVAVPVVDLRRYLGLARASLELHTPILIVHVAERTIGLIVDEVLGVLVLRDEQVARPSDVLPEGMDDVPILEGLTYSDNGMVVLLDLDYLFQPGQIQMLDQVIKTLPSLVSAELEQLIREREEPASANVASEASVTVATPARERTRVSTAKKEEPKAAAEGSARERTGKSSSETEEAKATAAEKPARKRKSSAKKEETKAAAAEKPTRKRARKSSAKKEGTATGEGKAEPARKEARQPKSSEGSGA